MCLLALVKFSWQWDIFIYSKAHQCGICLIALQKRVSGELGRMKIKLSFLFKWIPISGTEECDLYLIGHG